MRGQVSGRCDGHDLAAWRGMANMGSVCPDTGIMVSPYITHLDGSG